MKVRFQFDKIKRSAVKLC